MCLITLAAGVLGFCAAAPAADAHLRLPHHRGGHVRRAWPAKGRHGRPKLAMARWLARQVGPVKVHTAKHRIAAASSDPLAHAAAAGGAAGAGFQSTGPTQTLQLVRSYTIPSDDPSATRLANLSWTYDSAISAIAFLELGLKSQAQQLLDQLAALQRTDGSIDFAFDTQTGASIPLFRSGTVAWLGLAAVAYREKTCSTQYDSVALRAARWLLAQQVTSSSDPAYGLLRGGPDVSWVSTQHNLIARAFFKQLANAIAGARPCAGGLTGLTSSEATAFATQLRNAVSLIDAGVDRALLVHASASSAYFIEGVNDQVTPLDAQALGTLWLLGQGRKSDATAVRNFTESTMAFSGSVALSSNPATYNETYSGAGPYSGFRPYGTPASPDVMWSEGTFEMLLAMSRSGVSTASLAKSLRSFTALSGNAGPLQANGAVTGNVFNEYHVWPAAASAAWALLNRTNFGSLLQ